MISHLFSGILRTSLEILPAFSILFSVEEGAPGEAAVPEALPEGVRTCAMTCRYPSRMRYSVRKSKYLLCATRAVLPVTAAARIGEAEKVFVPPAAAAAR
ncbi:hypothetical protein ES703_101473 [subsurface metagenome]